MTTLTEKLSEKMSAEYNSFIESVKKLSTEEVINHAYEIVLKEDIKCCVEDMNFSPKELRALLSSKEPLDDLYRDWLKSDYSYLDVLKDCVSDSISYLEILKQKTERNDAR